MADIHITKLAAARRQLCSAVRMFFAQEDELAIHTVASASLSIISDLKSKRGTDLLSDAFLFGVFSAVQQYNKGTLPEHLLESSEFMEPVKALAEQIPDIDAIRFVDISGTLPSEFISEFWKKRNRIANFLKHADRDYTSHIRLDEVDNLQLLYFLIGSYASIDQSGIGDEGILFSVYYGLTQQEPELIPDYFREFANSLIPLSNEDRLRSCLDLLNEIKSIES